MTWRLIAIVAAALCFSVVLLGITGDLNPDKVLAAAGLLTLVAIVPPTGTL